MKTWILLLVLLLGFGLAGCGETETVREHRRMPEAETIDDRSLFDGLVFSNMKLLEQKSYTYAVGEIKNTNDVSVYGYFQLVFYNRSGDIVFVRNSVRLPGSSIRPNEEVAFSVMLERRDFSDVSRIVAKDSNILKR